MAVVWSGSELAHFSKVVQTPLREWQTAFVQATKLVPSAGIDVG
jgi:hypothetical protein